MTRPEGMGLGLAIARASLEAHGAAIEIADRPGGGARVSFSLPLVAEAPRTPETPAAADAGCEPPAATPAEESDETENPDRR